MIFIQPSDEENASIVTLKQQLTAAACTHPFTDVTVLRFLRGRKHVMDKALNGLIKHVEWREEYHVDTIVTDTSSFNKEIAQRKCIVSGFDRHGRPILYIVARNHDKNQRNLEELRSFIIHTIENTTRRAKPDDEKIIIVFDLSKFTLACMDYDAVKLIVNILQYNYPETLSVGLILNAPMLFSACWAVIKPWLDPVTAAKCVFVKTAQLSEYIDSDQIPVEIVDSGEKNNSSSEKASSEKASSSTHSLVGMDVGGGGVETAAKPTGAAAETGASKSSSAASTTSSLPTKKSSTSATTSSEPSTGDDTPSDTTVFNTAKMAAAIDTASTTTPTTTSTPLPLPSTVISATTKITTVATKLEG